CVEDARKCAYAPAMHLVFDGCQQNSGLPEFCISIMRRKSGEPDLRCQSRQWVHASGQSYCSTRGCDGLELAVQASGEDRDRPAVGVVRQVLQELIVERQDDAVDHIHSIKSLENLLGAIIEPAVADQDAEATRGDVIAVIA